MHQKLDMFQFNVNLFNISGIIPSENVNSSAWKLLLFRIFQILSTLLFISMVILQFLALHHYWGNMSLMIDCIGFLVGFAAIYFTCPYIMISWKNISKLIDTFENNSIFCNEIVTSNQRHMEIFNQSLKLARIFNRVVSPFVFLSGAMYIFPTFIQHLMASDEEILQEAESTDGFTKYFVFVIWLHPAVKKEFMIRVIYALQCICLMIGFSFASAFIPFEMVLFLHTATQFKLISSIIREMDKVMCRAENSGNAPHEFPEKLFTTDKKILSESFQSSMPEKRPETNLEEEKRATLSTERQLVSKMLQNFLQEDVIDLPLERLNDLSAAQIPSTEKNDPASLYLLECIKLHQACIK